MSVYKTTISNITKAFLVQAVNSFVKSQGGQIITSLTAYGGAKHDIDIGIKNQNLPNGIGFSVNSKGELEIKGDSWMQNQEFDRMRTLIPNYIKAYKATINAKAQHPTATFNVQVQQKQVLLEVCY